CAWWASRGRERLGRGPTRIAEGLELDPIAVGIEGEEAVDVEGLAEPRRRLDPHAGGGEPRVPGVDLRCHQRDDHATRLDEPPGPRAAEAEKAGGAGAVDPAWTLVERERQRQ